MSPIYVPGKLTLRKEFVWNETIWNPSMITTALWLDAADESTVTTVGGAVSQWNDKSGNGRNAAESFNRPAFTANGLNSKNVVTFDGVNDRLIINSSFLESYPFLIACVVKENNGGFGGVITTHGNTLDNSPALKINSSRKYQFDSGGPSPVIGILESVSTGAAWSLVCGRSISSNDHALFFNGSAEQTSSIALTISGAAPSTYLGTYRALANDTNFAAFNLAELIVLSSGVTDAVLEKIDGYLAHKWGLTANLPNDHPYKTVGPTP
jgi:hypothetical protein